MTTSTIRNQADKLVVYFKEKLKETLVSYKAIHSNHINLLIDKNYLSSTIKTIINDSNLKVKLLTLTATDERQLSNSFKLYTNFLTQGDYLLTLETTLDKDKPTYPAITLVTPQTEWYEREIHDLFGIIPDGINLDPLVLHRDWTRGKYFPMLKDFEINKQIPISEVAHEFNQPHGDGMYQIAVGPIHAGIIEPGHLRFCAIGEEIHKFDAQLFYTHKGIEKMAEGKTLDETLKIAEHVCGMCAYAHSTAFCQAIENLGNIKIPERASYIRTICLELERLSSHMFDLMSICSAGGFAFGSSHASRLREILMRAIKDLTGHRFLRGLNSIGGIRKDISNEEFKSLITKLKDFKKHFQEWEKLVLSSDSLLDRLEGAGYLSKEKAVSLGVVGPAARGSGVDTDIRREHPHPYLAYHNLSIKVPVYEDGDVLARTSVRIDEIYESLRCIKELIENLPNGKVAEEPPKEFSCYKPTLSIVESAKGELVHVVIIEPENKIFRFHVRSASYMNWRGMVQATMGQDNLKNIVPDGPLVNKSFNLCYACVDR